MYYFSLLRVVDECAYHGHMSNAQEEVPETPFRFRLAIALDRAGMSYIEMAEYLDVDPSTVSKWLHGVRNPKRGNVIAWALRTGVPFEWLATGGITGSTDTGTVTQRYPRRRTSDLLPAGLPFAADTGAVTRPVAA